MTPDDEPQESEDEEAITPADGAADPPATGDDAAPAIPSDIADLIGQLLEGAADGDGTTITTVQATYAAIVASAGPVPHPDVLRQYNEVVPDGADRIFKMAEDQSAHRISIEKTVTGSDSRRANLGLAAAVLVALATLGVSALITLNGQPIPGTVLGTVDLGAIVGVFVYGTESRKRERREQRQSLSPSQ